MNEHFQNIIFKSTGATASGETEMIQSRWSGYGQIVRCTLKGSDTESVIVKHIQLAEQSGHPRGWNTDISHQRKLKSYQVEVAWYDQWSEQCDNTCRIPNCLVLETHEN